MTAEEIKIKLGLDSRELDEGTRRAMQQIANFGQESEKSFIKVGNAGKGFKKLLQELSAESPIAGLALKAAFSPMVALFATITAGVVSLKNEIKALTEYADKIGSINAKAIGNVKDAQRAAGRANAKDRRRGDKEIDSINDTLNEQIDGAAPSARAALLASIEAQYDASKQNVFNYDLNQGDRDSKRLQIEKAKRDIESAKTQMAAYNEAAEKFKGSNTTVEEARNSGWSPLGVYNKTAAGLKYLFTGGGMMSEANAYQSSLQAAQGFQNNITKMEAAMQRLTESLEDDSDQHGDEVDRLKKLGEARKKLQQIIEKAAKEQSDYDLQHSKLLKSQAEQMNAPYTPGLNEMAQFRGPYGWVARESLAARSAAKMAMSLATPGEFASMNQEVIKAQGQFRSDWAGAANGPARQQAIRRYDERLQNLLTGRITPEHSLEVIADQIKALNTKAAGEGLIVRGTE